MHKLCQRFNKAQFWNRDPRVNICP